MRFVILFFVFSNLSFSQTEEKNSFFLNEYNFSINRSIYNLSLNTYGIGFGGYKTFGKGNKLNFLSGFEYNYTKQIQAFEFTGGHSGSEVDTNEFVISMNAISIPANIRLIFGAKTKVFTDFGFFVETIFNSKRRENVYPSNTNSLITFGSGSDIHAFNFGGIIGIGLSRQFGNIEYYIKPELRYGVFNNRYLKLCVGVKLK
jgi:hypothetical protein